MKNFFKSQRGINLITLSVTVIVILILTNIILYNVKDNLGVQNLKNMQADIENLREKVSAYDMQYGDIPVYCNQENQKVAYDINTKDIKNAKVISEMDGEIFYVINLSSLDNLTLNYGKDYEQIKKAEDINQFEDLYIISANTHNIFYAKGISFDGEKFYTDYTEENVDKEEVRIVENETENWSPSYDTTAIYKDENEDTAYIPEGFQVSRTSGENTINTGLVVKGADGSEFVWVPVDKNTLSAGGAKGKTMARKTSGEDANGKKNYQGVLYDFSEVSMKSTEMSDYGQETDKNREPDIVSTYDNDTKYNNGLFSKDTLQQEYNAMIESIKKYGGFYVGRYETSLSKEEDSLLEGIAQSKSNVMPTTANDTETNMWYGLYVKEKTYTGTNNSVQSSMIWGSQYDAMLNWIISSNSIDKEKIIKSENASHDLSNIYQSGTEKNDKINNIYDLEGNLQEWTLEANTSYFRVLRGGDCSHSYFPTTRITDNPYSNGISKVSYYGSRLTLYIK
jgi:type II secretory pathway pseudopilin PulG